MFLNQVLPTNVPLNVDRVYFHNFLTWYLPVPGASPGSMESMSKDR